MRLEYEGEFQFPSNGKVHLDFMTSTNLLCSLSCFNSLQTGRYIWTRYGQYTWESSGKFQFPSNGKVHLDTRDIAAGDARVEACFNSLQTGRYIWTLRLQVCNRR